MSNKVKTFSEAMEPLREEKKRQKEVREKRKTEGTTVSLKTWGVRLFHTFFFCLFTYVLVMMCTLLLPGIMAYVLAGLGYTLTTPAELMLALFSGLFLTAWFFAASYFLVKKVGKIYMNNMKNTMSKEAVDRLNKLD